MSIHPRGGQGGISPCTPSSHPSPAAEDEEQGQRASLESGDTLCSHLVPCQPQLSVHIHQAVTVQRHVLPNTLPPSTPPAEPRTSAPVGENLGAGDRTLVCVGSSRTQQQGRSLTRMFKGMQQKPQDLSHGDWVR